MITIPTIPNRDTTGIYSGGFSSPTKGGIYFRSDGISSFFRPDGSSIFTRP